MFTENIYSILDIPPSTPYEDVDLIKKAYRKKALQYHPDINSDNDNVFKQINEAYEIASNIEKRKEYDLHTGFNPNTPKVSIPRNFHDVFGFGFQPFFTRTNRRSILTITEPLYINYLQLFKGETFHKKIKIKGKIIEKDIIINPKEIKIYDELIKEEENDILIRFVPEIIDDRKIICKEASNIIIDKSLNMNIIFKIDFTKALSGGNYETTIFEEKFNFKIPSCCEMGHSLEVESLNLLPHSMGKVSFIYDLPKLTKNKIDSIIKIIKSK